MDKKLDRRDFLKTSTTLGAGAILGGAGLSGCSRSFRQEQESLQLPAGVAFRFGVIGDPHLVTVPHALAPHITNKHAEINNFATAMNRDAASFIICVGDNVHEGANGGIASRYNNEVFTNNVMTYKNAMLAFDREVYHVLGNHDVLGTLDMAGLRAVWDDPGARSHLPAGYYTFDYPEKNLRFIVLDAQYKSDGSHYTALDTGYAVGHIPPVQQNWLSGQLEQAKTGGWNVFVFCHQQISDDPVYGLAPVSNYTEVVMLLNSYSDIIRIVFGGHDHNGYMYERDGINYVHLKTMQDGVSWALVELRDDGAIRVDGHGHMPSLNIS
jgi:alkaline phosphatase